MHGAKSPDESGASLAHHGGNLDAARRRFPDAPAPWIDLSTGINPWPYPLPAFAPDVWTRLPEPALIARLERAAAAAYGVADPSRIVAAPGTQALIQWLPHVAPARRAGVLGFTYSEHQRVYAAAGAQVETVEELAELAGFDVAILVNPNNPDGRLTAWPALAELAAKMAARGGLLIIDEAFMDVLPPETSLAPHLPPAGAVILRSFGKTYGLAGARLGFAVAPEPLAGALRAALGPWAVSGPAAAAGLAALSDAVWLAATRTRLTVAAARLDSLLLVAGFEIAGGSPLFRLARHPSAPAWFEQLGRSGVLARPFAAKPEWLRFGIPGAEGDWLRLAEALGGKTGPAGV